MATNLLNCSLSSLLGLTFESISGLEEVIDGSASQFTLVMNGETYQAGGHNCNLSGVLLEFDDEDDYDIEDLVGCIVSEVDLQEEGYETQNGWVCKGQGRLSGTMKEDDSTWEIILGWSRGSTDN